MRLTMPRIKGSGALGPVRSLRLPRAVDRWFEARLLDDSRVAASELLLRLVYNGLRLRPGYMPRHRERLETLRGAHLDVEIAAYMQALRDTFGEDYIAHLEAWIRETTAVTDEW